MVGVTSLDASLSYLLLYSAPAPVPYINQPRVLVVYCYYQYLCEQNGWTTERTCRLVGWKGRWRYEGGQSKGLTSVASDDNYEE